MRSIEQLLFFLGPHPFPGEEISGTALLEVDTLRGEILIPLAVDICTKIDTAARRIDVILPEGLRDLNNE